QLPPKETDSKHEGTSLYEILKEWRREVALQRNIPLYCVLHNSTLMSIANQLPATKEELKRIKGMGSRKIESYGDDLLKIIAIYPHFPDTILQLAKKGYN
ncbi:MAG: HRDC domain-containing protein, partial [Candidatus Methanospirareceae archaeon]